MILLQPYLAFTTGELPESPTLHSGTSLSAGKEGQTLSGVSICWTLHLFNKGLNETGDLTVTRPCCKGSRARKTEPPCEASGGRGQRDAFRSPLSTNSGHTYQGGGGSFSQSSSEGLLYTAPPCSRPCNSVGIEMVFVDTLPSAKHTVGVQEIFLDLISEGPGAC